MKKSYIWLFLALHSLYLIFAFGLPSDPAVLSRYELTQLQARLLNLTIVIPVTAIYLVALYGAARLASYANKVKDSKEGPHLQRLATGLIVLAFSLPIGSIINSLSSYLKHRHPTIAIEAGVIRSYSALVISFIAIYLIAQGIQGLHNLHKRVNDVQAVPFYSYAGPLILASTFTWLVTMPVSGATPPEIQSLPDWFLILTFVVPFTYAWSIGIRAALQLYDYQKNVKGTIYKRALTNVSTGVGILIAVFILFQFLANLSSQLNRLSLNPLLLVLYVLVVVYSIGFIFVARGARKLKLIEEA